MKIKKATCIYFSPTGTTETIIKGISQGLTTERVDFVNITKQQNRKDVPQKVNGDLVILGTPVYYGRVPEIVAAYLSTLEADKTPIVLTVVYGNRAYEDSLRELNDIAVSKNFIPLAGGVFVAEHSYSSSDYPIAKGRPDNADLQKSKEFGEAIQDKINSLKSLDELPRLEIPGESPYIVPDNLHMIEKARTFVDLTPVTDTQKCTQCGDCAEACPTEAISHEDFSQTDKWKCIICYACIKSCPEDARQMKDPNFQAAVQMLHQNCQIRKEPEWYL